MQKKRMPIGSGIVLLESMTDGNINNDIRRDKDPEITNPPYAGIGLKKLDLKLLFSCGRQKSGIRFGGLEFGLLFNF